MEAAKIQLMMCEWKELQGEFAGYKYHSGIGQADAQRY